MPIDPNLNIIKDGIVFWYDCLFQTSYPDSGTTWFDLSGNEDDATLGNGVGYNSADGGSLTFDGVDDFVDTNVIYNLDASGTEFCITLWFRGPNQSATSILVSNYNNRPTPFNIYFRDDGRISTFTRNAANISFSLFSTNTFNDNVWHYAVFQKSGASSYSLYVDGNLEASGSANLGAIVPNTSIYIGLLRLFSQNPFLGNIAHVTLYDRALSSDEINHNYDQMKVRFGYNQMVEDYVVYLDASDSNSYSGSGSTWYDLSSNNYDANLVNGPTYDSGNGGSIVFDGVNDYGDLGTISELTGIYDVSVCAWVKPISNAGSASGTLINRYFNTNPNNGWSLSNSTSGEPFNFSFGGRENSSAFLSCPTTNKYYYGDWHYVVGVKSGNLWSIYVDGVLENSLTLGSGTVAFLNNVTYLAATPQFSDPPNRNNNINLAQVQIYDRALAASEVLNNFNAEKAKYGL